ncbi:MULTISPECIES: hypothetical protein [Roseobacter]|uniref:Uncharacterized protein n=1 Tax=Roseobacter litoralis (strain ATCC 49566 / DSM 6996 / JCM 21268 / NBRC 15278 / OCh 149) TaxID=391595 RepID=F7ZCE7_ROSLO|nr:MULTISPECIES: hypothetical protein [Roseobacter]AEI93178.1 hypothetical protein RLO149_c011740 [Roseobacter litoralis Och 149]GIT85105.1 hypothetical protein ROBYS_01210 [Roseobacter sp. OBYS 0001]
MLFPGAPKGERDSAFVQVQFGGLSDPAGGFAGAIYRPASILNALTQCLRRLSSHYIDLCHPTVTSVKVIQTVF